jgi:hypothetical protein
MPTALDGCASSDPPPAGDYQTMRLGMSPWYHNKPTNAITCGAETSLPAFDIPKPIVVFSRPIAHDSLFKATA